jgi:hypothetical protein
MFLTALLLLNTLATFDEHHKRRFLVTVANEHERESVSFSNYNCLARFAVDSIDSECCDLKSISMPTIECSFDCGHRMQLSFAFELFSLDDSHETERLFGLSLPGLLFQSCSNPVPTPPTPPPPLLRPSAFASFAFGSHSLLH